MAKDVTSRLRVFGFFWIEIDSHARFQGNYGLYFLVWDRWMGTLKEVSWPETKAQKAKAPPQEGGA